MTINTQHDKQTSKILWKSHIQFVQKKKKIERRNKIINIRIDIGAKTPWVVEAEEELKWI